MGRDEALEIIGISDTGRVRKHNEDSFASDLSLGLVVLADGMGGYKAGEVASAIAVTRVFCDTRDGLATLVAGQRERETGLSYESLVIREAVQNANAEVYETARARREFKGMGTTVLVVHFFDNRLSCAHLGDSRLYRLRNADIEQLTSDHTLLQEFKRSGYYSEDESELAYNSNMVTRALGVEKEVEVDILEQEVEVGDLYLLCSDGLTSMLSEGRIADVMLRCPQLLECGRQLVKLANKRGGEDNISIILVRINDEFEAEKDWQTQLIDWFNP